MEGNVRVVTMPDGTERLSGIRTGDSATWRYFKSPGAASSLVVCVVAKKGGLLELRDGRGASYGMAVVPPGDGVTVTEVSIPLTRPFPEGRTAIILGFNDSKGFVSMRKRKNDERFDVLSFVFTR